MEKQFKKDGSDKDLNKANYQALKEIRKIQKEHDNRLGKIETDLKAIQSTQDNHGDLLKQIIHLLKKEE